MSRGVEVGLLLGILLLTLIASWWLILRPVTDHDAAAFDALPTMLNGWHSLDIEMDEAVSEMLAADRNIQRAYLHPQGYQIFVYIGYYGTRSGGTPVHTPEVCYPAQGWAIIESSRHHVGGGDGFDLQEFVVERGGERRLVHFWYRTDRISGITSIAGLRFRHFWNRIARNRADGALIRLSTPVAGADFQAARSRLYGMDSEVEAQVAALWPPTPAKEAGGAARL